MHYKQHKKPRACARCKWGKHKVNWKPRFPFIHPSMAGEHVVGVTMEPGASWVRVRREQEKDNEYTLFCAACPDFYTRTVELYALQRHHDSRRHLANVATFLGICTGPSGLPVGSAPPSEEFLAVWQAANNQGVAEVGSRKRVRKLQGCLVAAMLHQERGFLAQAKTLVLIRDESKGVLLLRARACTVSLQYQAFLLGLARDSGADAIDITATTGNLLDKFAGNTELAKHLRLCCEAVCVDSASNETKSGRLMATEPSDNPVAPNLKCIIRDRAHASRRLISRPWKADPVLWELAETLVIRATHPPLHNIFFLVQG
jgi:hypothetical protein